mmetsp:Transcript_19977/g.30019  ORF Transcript_19977/g.30019 Transcript_19977/m.30019 type:complete len:80 (+) Transcript_19977:283-522(+)
MITLPLSQPIIYCISAFYSSKCCGASQNEIVQKIICIVINASDLVLLFRLRFWEEGGSNEKLFQEQRGCKPEDISWQFR